MRKKLLFYVITCLVVTIFISSCATIGTQFDEKQITKIEKGKTNQDQILKLFGEPSAKSINADGKMQWSYSYGHVPLVGKIETKTLYITFDKSGTVEDYTYSGGKY
ncbi:MAG: outer membrane protein assembly factor BamE [Nitrospinae bacterium]|nr:outer membrane protein assembly factor BamE [Nitrospinota bacterium]